MKSKDLDLWIAGQAERILWFYWETDNGFERNAGGSVFAPSVESGVAAAIASAALRYQWDPRKVRDIANVPAFRMVRSVFDPEVRAGDPMIVYTKEEVLYTCNYPEQIEKAANLMERLECASYLDTVEPTYVFNGGVITEVKKTYAKSISLQEDRH